jgi:two-component system sensor histidine kinase YesM
VLKLTLQPIVENAVLHGIGSREQGGFVTIRIYEQGHDLMIEVTDNGKGMTSEQMELLLGGSGKSGTSSRFSGMGVRNVHERIERMYDSPYGIKLYSEPGRYTKVEIRFPNIRGLAGSEREVI